MAQQMYLGCDQLFTKFMTALATHFDRCRVIQLRRVYILRETAELAQVFRELQL